MNQHSVIYLAGDSGMVGSALMRRLTELGFKRVITASHAELDLTDRKAVRAFMAEARPEYVFMAAALVGGIAANSSRPVEFAVDNAYMGLNVITAAHEYGVRKLLYLGSACCYPNSAPLPARESDLLCGAPEPTNEAYAMAKNLCTRLCGYYRREYGDDFIAVTPANCYGPGDSFEAGECHVIPSLIMKCHAAKNAGTPSIELWGTGSPLREFIYADDLADACVYLMEHYSGEEHVNIGTGTEISMLDLAKLVARVVGYGGDIVCNPARPDGKPRNSIDSSCLRALGWSPAHTLEEGIREEYRYYLEMIDTR